MKVIILSEISSSHTVHWVSSLSHRGYDIMLIGLLKADASEYADLPNVTVVSCGYEVSEASLASQRIQGKVQYLNAIQLIRKKIRQFKPDILHAHYASSYGLLGALTGFHPYIISVWGSDVYDYPRSGFLYRRLLHFSFHRADRLLSTSYCMAQEARRYTDKSFDITPFGVDVNHFQPCPVDKESTFIVGNVKCLEEIYGIDILIRAFAILRNNNPGRDMMLQIAGKGSKYDELKALTQQLGIEDQVKFLGYIDNKLLPEYYSRFDVAVSLSRRESFGVVAVEAMACECPVVTSSAPGFQEVVEDGVTGFIVPINDPEAAATALQKFVDDPSLRSRMGEAGRQRVLKLYNWEDNVTLMDAIYRQLGQ